ncbi:ribonuclease H-like domain-containing protein [Cyathus striatus]|nr:ribonuclease H-like domain-containing protein [Cyathus striatus]
MPTSKGPIWDHFYVGLKQNTSHSRAHCHGCVGVHRPSNEAIELDDEGNPILQDVSNYNFLVAIKDDIGGVCGVKSAMISHIKNCKNVSKDARKLAKGLEKPKEGGKRVREKDSDEDEEESTEGPAKKKHLHSKIKAKLEQSTLKLFRGINVPFDDEQKVIVRRQYLHATISANLPFRWVEDPEVIALFLLFRSTADVVMPSRLQVAGSLLDNEDEVVTMRLKMILKGKYAVVTSDGWKDQSRDSVNGVNLSVDGKTYLIDLILATAHKKDGVSMCKAFEGMVDKAEQDYGVQVVGFCCDNDGGSQRGRKNLILKRPWLFGPPCCAHQFQLILGDYFSVNKDAAATAEEATDLIGWILLHGRIRSLFNEAQAEIPPGRILSFLVANMTRWTTHFVAFDRLYELKNAIRRAVLLNRADIVAAQVGAENNRRKKDKLESEAMLYCDLIDDIAFWRRLKIVIDDLEPICLGTNLNQSDALRPDQALLSFAGIYLYFRTHSNTDVAAGMMKRVEKRWKASDQPMFVLALILNPFEGVARFGPKANISPFTLNTIILQMYRRVRSQPPSSPRTEMDEAVMAAKEKSVLEAFAAYLSSSGDFVDWSENMESWKQRMGTDPVLVWQAFKKMPASAELADFALLLLGISVNQAGMERTFSDLKIKKTRLQNCLKLPRLEKMSKVGAHIRESHKEAGFSKDHAKRANHKTEKVAELLAVPCYADLLETVEDGSSDQQSEGCQPVLVRSCKDWRVAMQKWIQRERDDLETDEDFEEDLAVLYGERRSKWLLRSLELLFSGRREVDEQEQEQRSRRQQVYTEEAQLMELLADEAADDDPTPDDGELEGSGDDFEG